MSRRICIVPGNIRGIGGPASFQRNLSTGLAQRGIAVTYDLNDEPYDAVLVINSTRQLPKLWRCKKRGIRIVQRLGSINRLQRYLPVGLQGRFLAEIRNLMMSWVRSSITDHIVYQSHFVKDRWEAGYGIAKVPSTVIYNGVDLGRFHPEGSRYQSGKELCIISVEGTQGADPFDIAIHLGLGLEKKGVRTELLIFGEQWKDGQVQADRYPFVSLRGVALHSELPHFYRGSALYISTDILTAGCPNSVLEALACGTPVLAYKVGVLPELLNETSGRCVDYQGDPWKGEPPRNREGLMDAALELLAEQERFRRGARRLAEERYELEQMVNDYIGALLG